MLDTIEFEQLLLQHAKIYLEKNQIFKINFKNGQFYKDSNFSQFSYLQLPVYMNYVDLTFVARFVRSIAFS